MNLRTLADAWLVIPVLVAAATGGSVDMGGAHRFEARSETTRSTGPAAHLHASAPLGAGVAGRTEPHARISGRSSGVVVPGARPADTSGLRSSPTITHLTPVMATAHVLYADFLGTCLACTSAEARPGQPAAEARGSRLAGEPGSEGQAPANGYSQGSLVSLPGNPLLHLALGEWEGRTWAADGSSGAHARAALVDLVAVDPGLLHLTAGDARSDAVSTRSGSDATSDTNGLTAVAGGGALSIVVLHAESSNGDSGRAYLASVNGTVVLESQRGIPDPSIAASRVLHLRLLHGDRDGADVGSAQDGKSQTMVGLITGRTGTPDDVGAEPLR
jgi:hypothetical protein